MDTNSATSKIEVITPEVASELLHKNTANRPINAAIVIKFSVSMSRGFWALNGEPIIISRNGDLLDGQHRLLAVVKSGCTITSFVVRGVDSEVFSTIDSGRSRNAGDVLAINGEKNVNKLGALLRCIIRWERGELDYHESRHTPILIEDICAALARHPLARESVSYCTQEPHLQSAGVAFIHYVATKARPEISRAFFDMLKDGLNAYAGAPAHTLRERLRTTLGSGTTTSRCETIALCIKAWNFYAQGKRVTCLRVAVSKSRDGSLTKEPFPSPIL
jgi:hypothetical protein